MVLYDSINEIPFLDNKDPGYTSDLKSILEKNIDSSVLIEDVSGFQGFVDDYLSYRNNIDNPDEYDKQLVLAIESNKNVIRQ